MLTLRVLKIRAVSVQAETCHESISCMPNFPPKIMRIVAYDQLICTLTTGVLAININHNAYSKNKHSLAKCMLFARQTKSANPAYGCHPTSSQAPLKGEYLDKFARHRSNRSKIN